MCIYIYIYAYICMYDVGVMKGCNASLLLQKRHATGQYRGPIREWQRNMETATLFGIVVQGLPSKLLPEC